MSSVAIFPVQRILEKLAKIGVDCQVYRQSVLTACSSSKVESHLKVPTEGYLEAAHLVNQPLHGCPGFTDVDANALGLSHRPMNLHQHMLKLALRAQGLIVNPVQAYVIRRKGLTQAAQSRHQCCKQHTRGRERELSRRAWDEQNWVSRSAHQIQVQVAEVQILQSSLQGGAHVCSAMVRVPAE